MLGQEKKGLATRNKQNSSFNLGEMPQTPHTIHPGIGGIAGVLGETITPISNILQFLAKQFDTGLQYRSVNTLRSAISTTHSSIDGLAVGKACLTCALHYHTILIHGICA